MERSGIIDVLKRCDLFGALEKNELERISGICGLAEFKPGEYIFSQGDISGCLYVIAEGSVHLERQLDLGHRKGSVTIDRLGPGRAFGCWPVLLGEDHSLFCSAVCLKAAELISIEGQPLREMMVADKGLGFRVLERLCRILRSRMSGVYGALEKL
jgi:CRP/FNR family transcriptional regulator, cyclic AMP receptor protein